MATQTGDLSVTQSTVALTSTVTVVNLITPGAVRWTFLIKNRQASANSIVVFAYIGALPGSVPPDTYELAAGAFLNNQLLGNITDQGIGVGWAAALLTAGTATVDMIWS